MNRCIQNWICSCSFCSKYKLIKIEREILRSFVLVCYHLLLGRYSPDGQNPKCTHCPRGFTTAGTGAKSVDECTGKKICISSVIIYILKYQKMFVSTIIIYILKYQKMFISTISIYILKYQKMFIPTMIIYILIYQKRCNLADEECVQ